MLAAAVLRLFPKAKYDIGSAIENGFYYDFDLPWMLISKDLEALEAEMNRIVAEDVPFERREYRSKKRGNDWKSCVSCINWNVWRISPRVSLFHCIVTVISNPLCSTSTCSFHTFSETIMLHFEQKGFPKPPTNFMLYFLYFFRHRNSFRVSIPDF